MRIFLVFLLLASCFKGFGQVPVHNFVPRNGQSDTLFSYKIFSKEVKKAKLKPLIDSKNSFRIRFRSDEQIVDIWSNNDLTYSGMITNFAEQCTSPEAKGRKVPYFMKKKKVSSNIAAKIFELYKSIDGIPTDDSIKGWDIGNDGKEYFIEIVTPTTYRFKTYRMPTAQESTLGEAKVIRSFIESLQSILGLEEEFQLFTSTLKQGCYKSGSSLVLLIVH